MNESQKHHGEGLFSEEAISAIDSVERFDEGIAIISSRSVLALGAIGLLLFLVLVWAIFGRVPVGLQGRGAMVAGSGVAPVVASSDGTLIALPGDVGTVVARGAAVARVRTTTGEIVALRAPAMGRLAQRSPQLGSFV